MDEEYRQRKMRVLLAEIVTLRHDLETSSLPSDPGSIDVLETHLRRLDERLERVRGAIEARAALPAAHAETPPGLVDDAIDVLFRSVAELRQMVDEWHPGDGRATLVN